uniref:Setae polypeptide n=1 Tax=Ochrogaster lunifer TaxID=319761 RepID=A0AA49ETC7_OCHLU|nr:setae polypeptide [Ochrogaster lunifer]
MRAVMILAALLVLTSVCCHVTHALSDSDQAVHKNVERVAPDRESFTRGARGGGVEEFKVA